MSNTIEVKVPDIGDFEAVEIIEVLVSPGDQIAVEDPLITVESDKASMEIPSSSAGTVKSVLVSLGDTVSEGSIIIELEASESQGKIEKSELSAEESSTAVRSDIMLSEKDEEGSA